MDFSAFSRRALMAGACFLIGKLFGILGITLAWAGVYVHDRGVRPIGAALLVLDAIMLAVSVYLCLTDMRQQAKQSSADDEAVERLLADGTLNEALERRGYRLAKQPGATG